MLETLLSISETWAVALLLFVSALALNKSERFGRYATALWFPAGLLLARKLALFIPISGSVSTEDQVFFWSTPSYWYASVFIVINGLIVAAIHFREDLNMDNGIGCLSLAVPIVLIIVSAAVLPLDGWTTHIFSPLVGLVGATKLMLVSPMLFPIAVVTLLLQIVLLILARGVSGREINKLALVCVVLGGLLHFGMQRIIPAPPIVTEIKTKWKTENPGETNGDSEPQTEDFLTVWSGKLGEMSELRLNTVEKKPPYANADEVRTNVGESLHSWWKNIWPDDLPKNALLAALGCLLVLAMIERFQAGETSRRRS